MAFSMTEILFTPSAIADLRDVQTYISLELENESAARKVIAKITKSIRQLEMFPEMGTPLSSITPFPTDYRYIVSNHYMIFYRLEGQTVQIMRILSGRRDYLRILFGE